MSHHRVIIEILHRANRFYNVLHFDNPDGLHTDAQICTIINNTWCQQMRGLLHPQWSFSKITSQNRTGGIIPLPFEMIPTFSAGVAGGGPLPPQNAHIFRLQTGFTGRRRRGRIFFPATSTQLCDGGQLSGDGITVTTARRQNLLDWFCGGTGGQPAQGIFLEVYSRSDDAYRRVSNIIVDTVIRTQRRREIGVGV